MEFRLKGSHTMDLTARVVGLATVIKEEVAIACPQTLSK